MSESGSRRDQDRDQRRLAELIAELESLPDPQARECAKALVQGVLELHAAGLDRMLAILADGGDLGRSNIETMARDETVRALLLLHGLHPHDLKARVQQAVNKLHARLASQGVRIALLQAADASVRVALSGRWQGKSFSAATLTEEIETEIFEAAPAVATVEIEGLADVNTHPIKFVASARQAHRPAANPEAAF